jgi:PAS domain S-box-containing protein
VADRPRAAALDALAHRLLRVLHAMPVGVMVADDTGRWEITNAAAARLAARDLATLDCWDVALVDAQGNAAGTVRVVADASGRQAVERALADSEARYRAIFDNAWMPFVLLDEDGRLLQYNEAWAHMLGYGAGEVDAASLVPVDWRPAASRRGDEGTGQATGGLRPPWEQSYIRKDGSLCWGETRIVCPIRDDVSGGVVHLAVVQDVTERHRLEDSLRGAAAEAESANRAKSAFLATMSHEIRTPLNGVMGMLELALHRPLEPEVADLLSISYGSARSLLGIIDNILDFSKIEAGHMAVERVPMGPADLVEDVAESLAGTAAAKGVRIAVEVDPAAPPTVLGDPLRLRQVLTNLAGNALKFTEAGEVVLAMALEPPLGRPAPDPAVALRFAVRDTGIGIAPDALPRLFKPFSQAEDSTTRRFGGTGLGLSISQRLVALMGGDLVAESEQGRGSTFSFVLPCPRADAAGEPPPSLAGLRCRVALGDDGEARQIGRLLRAAGADLIGDGDGCTGEGVAAAVTVGEAPFVVTGPGVRLTDVGAKTIGPAAPGVYDLPRPVRRRALCRAVARAAGQPGAGAEAEAAEGPISRRHRRLRLLVAEDNTVNAKVLRRQLAHFGIEADVYGDGATALEAWRGGGYAALLTDCHMPVMDGYALARALRGEEGPKTSGRLPIIALTANAVQEEEARCHEAGMDAVLTKPVTLDTLGACLQTWLPAKAAEATAEAEPEAAEAMPKAAAGAEHPSAAPLDLGALHRQVGGDADFLRDILADFRRALSDGVAGLHAAAADGAWADAAERAHKLKGTAGALGARRLSEACRAFEAAAPDDAAAAGLLAAVRAEHATIETWLDGPHGPLAPREGS